MDRGGRAIAGQRQKPNDLLVNKRGGRAKALTVIRRDVGFVAPAPPVGLRAYGKARWEEFWRSDNAMAVDVNAHREDLDRWIKVVDERERLWQIVKKAPVIKGSHGQLIRNPLALTIRDYTAEIAWLSDRFLMNPLAEFRAQFTASEAGKSATELLKMLMEDEPKDEPEIIDVEAL